MPDTLASFAEPTTRPNKARCAKATKTCQKGPRPKAAVLGKSQASPAATIAAIVAAETAHVLPSVIFGEADQIEIGARRARIAFDLVWPIIDDIPGSRIDQLEGHTDQLYLLLAIVSTELDAAHGRANKITDAARALKQPVPPLSLGNGDGLVALRLQLQAAEGALNKDDVPEEGPVVDAYHAANDRFIDAPARTPADMLLKLERLAEIEEMEEPTIRSPDRIVLNLIRDLRGALGFNGQVQ